MKKFIAAMAAAGALLSAPLFVEPTYSPLAISQAEAANIVDLPISSLRDGSGTTIAQLCADKPLLLNFWASWCPPCVGELPHFDAKFKKYGDKINFAAVSVDEDEASARSYTDGQGAGMSLPFYYGDTNAIGNAYKLESIPVTLLVAPGGEIALQIVGGLSAEDLEELLQAAL